MLRFLNSISLVAALATAGLSTALRAEDTPNETVAAAGATDAASIATIAADAAAAVGDTEAGEQEISEPVYVQFRDLFDHKGKPSPRAVALAGRTIEMIGFVADPPSDDSPFMVFVGSPSEFCPYCSSIDEEDHLPYVLVYTDAPLDRVSATTRIRVTGRLQASHDYEPAYGLHNDVRLWEATVVYDQGVRRGTRPRPADTAPKQTTVRTSDNEVD